MDDSRDLNMSPSRASRDDGIIRKARRSRFPSRLLLVVLFRCRWSDRLLLDPVQVLEVLLLKKTLNPVAPQFSNRSASQRIPTVVNLLHLEREKMIIGDKGDGVSRIERVKGFAGWRERQGKERENWLNQGVS